MKRLYRNILIVAAHVNRNPYAIALSRRQTHAFGGRRSSDCLDSEILADLSRKVIVYFHVSGNRGSSILDWIPPPGMPGSFLEKFASLLAQLPQERMSLHELLSSHTFFKPQLVCTPSRGAVDHSTGVIAVRCHPRVLHSNAAHPGYLPAFLKRKPTGW